MFCVMFWFHHHFKCTCYRITNKIKLVENPFWSIESARFTFGFFFGAPPENILMNTYTHEEKNTHIKKSPTKISFQIKFFPPPFQHERKKTVFFFVPLFFNEQFIPLFPFSYPLLFGRSFWRIIYHPLLQLILYIIGSVSSWRGTL